MPATSSVPSFISQLPKFEERINISFSNKAILQEALTHRSASKMIRKEVFTHNERLEFLGDAVLKLIVSDFLFKTLPEENEGRLTKIRAYIISDKFLFKLSHLINIGSYMLFSYGELQSGGNTRHSNLANAFEAILGAIYLDQGLETARDFFMTYYHQIKLNIHEYEQKDYKSILQEFCQKEYKELPTYTLTKEEGPEHEKKFFVHLILPNKENHFEGIGHSKKLAEQNAALLAIEWLNIL